MEHFGFGRIVMGSYTNGLGVHGDTAERDKDSFFPSTLTCLVLYEF
jgi:hypothetical protein